MKQVSSGFPVNNTEVPRNQVNPKTLKRLTESAAAVPLEGNQPERWQEMSDRIASNDELSKDDLGSIQDLARDSKAESRRLRKELAATGFQDRDLKAQLVPFNVFHTELDKVQEAHRLSSAKAAVQAVASSSFGPAGLVSAYHAYAGLPKSGLQALVREMESEPGKLSYAGNKVAQVHQEELWKSMTDLLDEGTRSAQSGKPVEVNAQYYELTSQTFIHKLVENAEAGNKVRINVDPSRLTPFQGSTANIDDLPDKMRGLLQLLDAPGDVAVSTYPVAKILGTQQDLMHRKGLRVGDKFLLSGMNANSGSGENIDAGYIIEGPASRRLVETFARDVEQSKNNTFDDLYGKNAIEGFMGRDVRMGRRGLTALADALDGPAPPGSSTLRPKTYAQMESVFKERGFELHKFLDLPKEEQGEKLDSAIESNTPLPLSDYGKRRVIDLIKLVQREINSPENQKRLDDISLPSDDPKGTTVVSLADTPTERETLMIQTIHEAEKHIYMPAFVITRPVAAALAAKKKEMEEAGKPIDIRILADPGIYPDGGTPNSWGVKYLEDQGIDVRWAAIPRTDGHDRKIHAKEMLTDKGDFVGSTNFSKKGLRDNHEHSGVIHFNPDDPESMALHEKSKSAFEDLWDNYSLTSNSKTIATRWKSRYRGADREHQIEDARGGAIRQAIRGIENYEKQSATWMQEQVEERGLNKQIAALMQEGYDMGNATLKAVQDSMGKEDFLAGLHSLESYQVLDKLRT